MARHSKVSKLPKAVRDWLDRALVNANFQDYDLFVEELEQRGYAISRTALTRHGRALKERTARIRDFNLAAGVLNDAAEDKAGLRESALMALLEAELFDLLMKLEAPADDAKEQAARLKLLAGASKFVASLTRSSIHQKKWAVELDTLQRAADAVEREALRQGLTKEAADGLRSTILGLQTPQAPTIRKPVKASRPRKRTA